jgi:2-polyprenyl-6-hydroxyphenyl methylase/3-demethylubiquinone-9 3-methyltransferase
LNHIYHQYGFSSEAKSHMHAHFLPHVLRFAGKLARGTRVLDVGCGNGFLCGEFLKRDCEVVGVDLSTQGIELARRTYPRGRFELLSADGNFLERLHEPPFDIVVSTEVVEHLYAPRSWAKGCFEALKPGGRFICTTPYHGYLKNLVISLLGKWGSHANPLWDGGHIKIWSKKSLSRLLTETGFIRAEFRGAGRMPALWMTMIVKAEKPL